LPGRASINLNAPYARRELNQCIDAINSLIGESSGVTKVVKTPRKFERRIEFELNQPKQLLVPLAESPLTCSVAEIFLV
jgi:hypothetical protein